MQLVKSTPEKWVTLFKNGVARRAEEANPVLEARRRREELLKEEERKAGPMDWSNINPKPKEDRGRIAERRAMEQMRVKTKADAINDTPTLTAANHWLGARAALVWREGCVRCSRHSNPGDLRAISGQRACRQPSRRLHPRGTHPGGARSSLPSPTPLAWRPQEVLEGQPDGPEGEPLFDWTETRSELVCRAKTRPGLRPADIELRATRKSAEVRVCG